MKCLKCGLDNTEGNIVCTNCGNIIVENNNQSPNVSPQPIETQQYQTPQATNQDFVNTQQQIPKSYIIGKLIPIIIVVVVIGIVAYKFFNNSNKIISNEKFIEIMKNNNYKTSDNLEKLSKDEVFAKYNELNDYVSSTSAYNDKNGILIYYTIFKNNSVSKKKIESVAKTLKDDIIESKTGLGYASYYLSLGHNDYNYYIRVNNSFLYIVFSEGKLDDVNNIINELGYSKYIKNNER